MIPLAILGSTDLSLGAKLTYGLLARYAGKTGECFPCEETLAANLGVSPRQIRRYIRELQTRQFLCSERKRVRNRRKASNVYTFLWHSVFNRTDPSGGNDAERTDMSFCERTDVSAPPTGKGVIGSESDKGDLANQNHDRQERYLKLLESGLSGTEATRRVREAGA
jgi:helix-turn-helix protein